MSGNYPTQAVSGAHPGFETVNFKINTPVLTTDTFSGKRRRVALGTSFYTFTAKYSNVTAYSMGAVTGFLAAQLGQFDNFSIIVDELSYSKSPNPPSTTPATSATLAAGSNSVTLTNCGNTKTVLAAGDFFKFANHTKVYMAVNDIVSSAGGSATLTFSGACVNSVPSGTNLTITAVPFNVICDNEIQEYTVGNGGISTMSVDFREVW